MIKNWFITGDTHGQNFERIYQNLREGDNTTALIILGDSGFNFYKSAGRRHRMKMEVESLETFVYCVRGN